MQLDFKKVKLSNRDIKRIYFDAFPKNERMQWKKIKFTMHDDIVRKTRRILAMEQFRNERIAELTSRYHLENLQGMYAGIFTGLMEKGILKKDDPELVALEFVSPVSLLIHMYDRQPERETEVLETIRKHFEHFAKVYGKERCCDGLKQEAHWL